MKMEKCRIKEIEATIEFAFFNSAFFWFSQKFKFLNSIYFNEVRVSRVTKSSYETELHKMTPYFELLTQLLNIKLNFKLLTRRFNFYFSTLSY